MFLGILLNVKCSYRGKGFLFLRLRGIRSFWKNKTKQNTCIYVLVKDTELDVSKLYFFAVQNMHIFIFLWTLYLSASSTSYRVEYQLLL